MDFLEGSCVIKGCTEGMRVEIREWGGVILSNFMALVSNEHLFFNLSLNVI